jgi:hypothetical protein
MNPNTLTYQHKVDRVWCFGSNKIKEKEKQGERKNANY